MFINKALLSFAKGSWKKIMTSIIFQLLITFISSVTALFMSQLIRRSILSKQIFSKEIILLISVIMGLLLISFVMNRINVYIVTKAGIAIKDNVRTQMMQKLFLLGPAYTATIRTGALTSTFTTRVEWLMNYYTKYLPIVLSAILNALLFILFLFHIDKYTGITAFFSVVMMLIIPMLFFKMMKDRGKKEWEHHAKYYSECLDGIQGMTNLKAFNADEKFVRQIKTYGENYRKSIMEHLRITIIEGTFSEFFARVGTALTIAILGWRAVYGYVDKGWLILSFFSIGATFSPMLALINAWHIGFQGVAGSYSIHEFMQIKKEHLLSNHFIPKRLMSREDLLKYMAQYPDKKRVFDERDFRLSFKNVSFRYHEGLDNAVDGISFDVMRGKMIAFVGHSGSGKSTIANLLVGFYRPCKGCISMNGRELTDENIDYFHQNISCVWQENHLFSGTLDENMKLGKEDVRKEAVERDAKRAKIHDLIQSLPEKYDTKVNELSSKFSTGERQRIAITRALIKDAALILFDEATSSLDRQNEIDIQKTIEELKKEKAIFIIAHRLATVQMADEICVLEKGKIIARGTHEDLMKGSKAYQKLMGGAVGTN